MRDNKYNTFNQLDDIAGKDSSLGQLLIRAQHMLTHQETVRGALEPSSRAHCSLANFRNGTLYLQVDTAAWATRIRMQQRPLIAQLKKTPAFSTINTVRVTVHPRFKTLSPARQAKPISLSASNHLNETAASIKDEQLKTALQNLARACTKRP